jgi:hypothetical protein
MNKISFLDELMKLGGVRVVIKTASSVIGSPPDGMVSDEAAPKADLVRPDEVATWSKPAGKSAGTIAQGTQGEITSSPDPIDRLRFNRGYQGPTA